jgi:hypothetical protein
MNEWKLLLQELMQAVQQVMQSGEVLSDEFQGMLAQTLGNLVTRAENNVSPEQNGPPPTDELPGNPSNDAQLLWVLAGQQQQAFISYLRKFPTPATQLLLNDPNALNATIEQLTRIMPQGNQPVVDGIQHADLNSSNVWGANYDQRSGKMRVRFQGGLEYEYDGIPPAIFNAFIHGNASARTDGRNRYGRWWINKNPSLGAALNQYIKAGGFNYRRLR